MVKISVVVPTYNRADILENCLNSLSNQSFNDFEVVVVDDGSTDDTKKVVESFKNNLNIIYKFQKNKGPAATRNKGVKNAKAGIIAFIDDDCIADKNWLSCAYNAMKNSSVSGVEGKTASKGKLGPFRQYMSNTKYGRFPTCNMIYRKKNIVDVGLFDNTYDFGNHFREDTDIAYKVITSGGKIVFDPKVKVIHPAYKVSFSSVLRKKRIFVVDPYLFKKFPALYKRFIRFPFELFTPFYLLFTLISLFFPWFFVSVFALTFVELGYRRWSVNLADYLKFVFLQVLSSFVIVYAVVKGLIKFRVNPIRFLF